MTNKKKKNLSAVAWLNLVLGLYNLYCFSVGSLTFNLIVGILNVGAWAFCRNPENISILLKGFANQNNKN